MSDNRSYAALEWLIGEIGETLGQARQSLEAYVENPEDAAQLRFCLAHIHQVHGSLQMVEFHGAALLAEEMESLAKALIADQVRNIGEAQEVLMRAILQLPVYLDKVKANRQDNPAVVLPLLNDLRAVRGESLLTETKLFTPDLAPAHRVANEKAAQAIDPQQFLVVVHKLRQMYQYAAAGVIRNYKREENIAYLHKVFARLRKLTHGTARQPLWDISLALLEGLNHEVIESSATVKGLLRQLDKEIKVLVDEGVKALNTFTNDELIKNLLYYIANARHDGKYIRRIKELYNLESALRDAAAEENLTSDLEAIRSVVDALTDELDAIKRILDSTLGGSDDLSLADAPPLIKRVADTMAVLGIGDLRKQLLAQGELLSAAGDNPGPDILMQVANNIAEIENSLELLARRGGQPDGATSGIAALDSAQETVLRESRNGLEQIKDAIIEYIASQWDRSHLANVPKQLKDIGGGLDMIPLVKPAAILRSCANFVERELLNKELQPDWSTLDTLADAIASVEYYLERLSGDSQEEDEHLLGVAEDSVRALGYPVPAHLAGSRRDSSATVEIPSLIEELEIGLPASDSYDQEETAQAEPEEPALEIHQPEPVEEKPAVAAESAAPSADATAGAAAGDDEDVDEEILEIFVDEAEEVIETIREYFPRWAENFEDNEALIEFRRAFHTLKGSGRMVKAHDIGELAWAIENMLNRVIDQMVEPSDSHVEVIQQVMAILPSMVEAFAARQPAPDRPRVEQLRTWADALSRGEDVVGLAAAAQPAEPQADDLQPVAEYAAEDESPDSLLWDIFGSEAQSHLAVVQSYIDEMDAAAPLFAPPTDHLQRALHTLKGSAHMADITPIAEMVAPLERFVKELHIYQVSIDADILQLLKDSVSYARGVLDQIVAGETLEIPRLAQFLARLAELRDRSVVPLIRQREAEDQAAQQVDPELLSIFMAEEMKLLLDVDELIRPWRAAGQIDAEQARPVMNELDILQQGAERANLPPMAELSGRLRQLYEVALDGPLQQEDGLYEVLLDGHDQLLDMVDAVAVGQNLKPESEDLRQRLDQLFEQAATSFEEPEQHQELADPSEDLVADEQQDAAEEVQAPLSEEVEPDQQQSAADTPEASPAAQEHVVPEEDNSEDTAEVDLEVFEIFVEEADELLEEIDEAVHEWQLDWDDHSHVEVLKRALHTLKGGARLAGLMGLGQLAHEFESFLIARGDAPEVDQGFFEIVHQYQDKLISGTDKVKARVAGHVPDGLEEVMAAQDTVAEQEDAELSQPQSGADESPAAIPVAEKPQADILPFAPKPKTEVSEAPSAPTPPAASGGFGGGAMAARRSGPQEVVKVSAELLEELVNLAGETSISRGRLEEQNSEINYAIEEMESTIQRLQEQLRRLDIETEAQMIFRQEQMEENEEFDPLEMDRYSQLQQLSRSLMESASDLMDLTQTLSDKTRGTETLLLQQSRINTDLQEGLMRSRMVPFSRMVPRLRRIVRQIATEVDKKVAFELENVDGELDRSVLERMVAPLEHMLRNAVDHGIESPEERVAAGKPEEGRILLSLKREGGDVVIRLIDDGRGLNLDRIREKAIERGLMSADAVLSDQDIMQFILRAGFSTADKVTQISGRGVGMDVVNAEIKQLGGSVFIDSRWGEGTTFTIRLPFTVSVNRALMIQVCEHSYAIPLNTIEGIVRISPFELEHYYQDANARFEYAGENYRVRYLGNMLDHSHLPRLESQSLPLPVILVRAAETAVALQVDRLMGSREIVVKSLGPQFASVEGISGATVMGDGSVVVILDPVAIIRKEMALHAFRHVPPVEWTSPEVEAEQEDRPQQILVVDDSVTVRKVTSRFLEREGYEVMTAKDGADALMILQDNIPDLMLLDIEMPRMDGFEVAKNIRSSSRLRDIPIIMITSRTGEKHRERAFELGVNKYLGKPYQEDVLLSNIQELIGEPVIG